MRAINNKTWILLLTFSMVMLSCTEEISEEIQNSESVPSSSSAADLFEDKAFRVVLSDEDENFSYAIHKEGSIDTECELDSPTLGFDVDDYDKTDPNYVIDCVIEAEELDIYFEGARFNVEVDDNLCEYVSYEPFKFFTYQPGATQRKVYEIECDDTCGDNLPDICDKSFRTYDDSVLSVGGFCWDPGTEAQIAGPTDKDTCEAAGTDYVWIADPDSDDINYSNFSDIATLFSDEIKSTNDLCQFNYAERYGDPDAPNCDPGSVTTFTYLLAVTTGRGECDTQPNIRDSEALCTMTGSWLEDEEVADNSFCYYAVTPEITGDSSEAACLVNGFDWYDLTDYTFDDPWGVAGADGTKDGVDDVPRLGAAECSTLPAYWEQHDSDGDGVGETGTSDGNTPLVDERHDNDLDGDYDMDDYRMSVDFNVVHCRENGGEWTGPVCIDQDGDGAADTDGNGIDFDDSTTDGDGDTADYENFEYTRFQSKVLCQANVNHTWSTGNCSVDEFIVTTEAACEQSGNWEEPEVCEATQQVEVELTDESEEDCGGSLDKCLGGPSTDFFSGDAESNIEVYTNEELEFFTQEFEAPAPSSDTSDKDSNMYVANYSRICSDTTNTKADADFDATLTSIEGDEIEELAPNTTYSPINVDSNSDGVVDYKIYASTPFNGRAVASAPRANVRPYYALRCLDPSLDTKAQIRVFIREWDKSFTATNTYKALISDINQGANARMDVEGDQEDGSPWNDVNDWDNLLYDYDFDPTVDDNTVATDGGTYDYVYEDNSCQNLNVGYCMDYATPARTADTNQTDCEIGGFTWIPSIVEYCYNETTEAKDGAYTDRDTCEDAVVDDNADGVDDDMVWTVRAAGFPEDNL